MARTAVRKIEDPPRRKIMDVIIFAGIAITLVFALVGLASAGIFVAGKVSGGSKTHHTAQSTHANTGGSQQVAAARVQATQIVRAARAAEHSIVASVTRRANRRASSILRSARQAAARTRAAAASAASSAPSPPSASTGSSATTSAPTTSTGSATSGTLGSTGTTASSGASSPSTTTGVSPAAPATGVQTYATPVAPVSSAPANLSGLPATWKVVAYNATFGSGPGSAGSITVTNRSTRAFSGTARVAYTGGGSATASFAGVEPGQTVVLPLNGTAYPGLGFHIQVLDVH